VDFFETNPSCSPPSLSSSLHLSSSPTAKMVSPSNEARGRVDGLVGLGAGSGETDR
jgi:hypothetical protein